MKKAKTPLSAFVRIVAVMLMVCMCGTVYAGDSDAYSATDNAPQAAAMDAGSVDYQMDATMTWYTEGESDDYQTGEGSDVEDDESDEEESGETSGGGTTTTTTTAPVIRSGHQARTRTAPSAAPQATRPAALPAARPAVTIPRRAPTLPPTITPPASTIQQNPVPALRQPSKIDAQTQKSTVHHLTERRMERRVIRERRNAMQQQRFLSLKADLLSDSPCTPETGADPPAGWLMSMGFVTLALGYSHRARYGKGKRKKAISTKHIVAHTLCMLGLLCMLTGALMFTDTLIIKAHAETSIPSYRMYNGQLRNAQGTALTTPHSIRFSYWNTSDAVPSDLTATGAIKKTAPQFVGWQEEHVITPNVSGNFNVKLGSVKVLADFESLSISEARNLHMQVEVKPAGAPDSAYQILDIKPSDPLVDRTPILPVPFARNADLLDLHDVGTGSGAIPYLFSGGLLPVSTMPGATNRDTFVIDANNDAAQPTLQFGGALAKKLTYDAANARFSFNDDLQVVGDLSVTGLINGIDIGSLSVASDANLKVTSLTGLLVSVAAGGYRVNGKTVYYEGSSDVLLSNGTNYLFFTEAGFQKNTTGFPADKSYVPVAEVTTFLGLVTSIVDRRVLLSDDREWRREQMLHPSYENAAYEGDGSNNVGQLAVAHDESSKRNHYVWTSSRTELQDYDIFVRIPVSQTFNTWNTTGTNNPLAITYRSGTANTADNKLDIAVFDTAGAQVTLSGSVINLTGTSWQTAQIEFTGTPTWTKGQSFLMRLRVSAKSTGNMQLGEVSFKSIEISN